MKIWFQKHVVAGRVPGLDEGLATHLGRIARPGTQVEFHSLPPQTYHGPLPEQYVRFGAVESLFSAYFSLQAIRAQRKGYDAFVIGTAQDPGLIEARAWAQIPVLGFGETAMHVASMLAQRFSFVGFIHELAEPLSANARRYGFSERLGPFGLVEGEGKVVEQAFAGESGPFLQAFERAALKVISTGTEVIIPGDGLTNEILVASTVQTLNGVPVLDANGLLVKMAEHFVDLFKLGLMGKPTTGYYNRRPNDSVLNHLLRLFAPRSFPLDN